jgi:hypothetical protein
MKAPPAFANDFPTKPLPDIEGGMGILVCLVCKKAHASPIMQIRCMEHEILRLRVEIERSAPALARIAKLDQIVKEYKRFPTPRYGSK